MSDKNRTAGQIMNRNRVPDTTANANTGFWRKAKQPIIAAIISFTALSAVSAQDTASQQSKFVPFSEFVQNVRAVQASEVMAASAARVTNTSSVEPMRQHLLSLYNGLSVSHSFVVGSQTADCVSMFDQPSVRAMGITNIATPPSVASAPAAAGDDSAVKPLAVETQLAEAKATDAFGNSMTCEAGTIPMRRVTLDEMARFGSLAAYFQKGPNGAGHAHIPGQFEAPATELHKYSYTYQNVANWGNSDTINLWRPYIYTDIGEIFSLAQSWTIGTGSTTQTAEVGWQNYPARTGTQNSVPFIYFTADGYNKTGCYDLTCTAFVQVSNAITFGVPWGAASYSVPDGGQTEVTFAWEFYQGNWWLRYGNTWIGYYPGAIYNGGQLTRYSNLLEFGSESVGSTVWPAEGSGQWANTGFTYGAYQRELWYILPNTSYTTAWDTLTASQPSPACYSISGPAYASNWGTYFFFGGPGGAACQ